MLHMIIFIILIIIGGCSLLLSAIGLIILPFSMLIPLEFSTIFKVFITGVIFLGAAIGYMVLLSSKEQYDKRIVHK